MTADSTTGSVGQLLRAPIRSTAGEVVVLSGHEAVLEEAVLAVADAGEHGDAPERVRLLGTERALEAACDRFHTASRAADLIDGGRLSLRATTESHLPSVLLTAGEVSDPSRHSGVGSVTSLSVLPGGDAVAVRTDSDDAVSSVRTAFDRSFAAAAPFAVSVPGYTRFLESLEAVVGPDVCADVECVLADGAPVRRSGGALDGLDTVLLMGGRNSAQLYELSEWAEDLEVASRATMSSRKRQLEAAGLLTTEKVPADVGRPRQRLRLDADGLRDASPPEVVRAAQDVLVDQ